MCNLGGAIGIAVASVLINRSLRSDLSRTIPLEYVQPAIELPSFIYDGLTKQYLQPVTQAYNDAFQCLWYMMTVAAIIRRFAGKGLKGLRMTLLL